MGWTGVHKPKWIKAVDFLKDEWKSNTNYEIIATAMKGFTEIHFAVKDKNLDFIFAVVYLVQFSKGYENFTYKSMDEFCGPNVNCPEKILKLLTPLDEIAKKEGVDIKEDNGYGWAKAWRERSWEAINKRKATPTFSSGDIIEIDHKIRFTNGTATEYFKKDGKNVYAMLRIENEFRMLFRVRLNHKNFNYKKVEVAEEVK